MKLATILSIAFMSISTVSMADAPKPTLSGRTLIESVEVYNRGDVQFETTTHITNQGQLNVTLKKLDRSKGPATQSDLVTVAEMTTPLTWTERREFRAMRNRLAVAPISVIQNGTVCAMYPSGLYAKSLSVAQIYTTLPGTAHVGPLKVINNYPRCWYRQTIYPANASDRELAQKLRNKVESIAFAMVRDYVGYAK